jgi:hypothetical protein
MECLPGIMSRARKAKRGYLIFCTFVGMPKVKTRRREKRLRSAGEWIKTYTGKHIVKGYAKHYAVDPLCAIVELRMLGVAITDDYVDAVKRSIADRTLQKRKRQEAGERQAELMGDNSDDTFAYIAGYTSGGAPYGITWEEMGNMETCDF